MTTKQLTVLTENSAWHLNRIITQLGQEGVDIRAHCLVDNVDGHCKLRLIVSEPDKAVEILQLKKFGTVVTDVIIIETDDRPGGLSRTLALFEKDDIQIEYSYTAASEFPGVALMVFRFSDNQKAVSVLEKNGVNILDRSL